MSKINLLISLNNWTSFHNHWIRKIVNEYFNIIPVEQNYQHSPKDTILVSNLTTERWYDDLHQKGYPLLIDHLWGNGVHEYPKDAYLLTNKNWFWYNEALHYENLGHHNYIPNKNYSKIAFLPMWSQKHHRDQLIEQIEDHLENFIYSYANRGIVLPGDDKNKTTRYNHFEPDWYDSTYYTIVTETTVNDPDFMISEKTYKPIAFYHPFLVVGQPKILNYLSNLGFETYENLFDESYDNDQDFQVRLGKIVKNIKNYTLLPYDKITQDKLQHNHNLFFDISLVRKRIIAEIIEPIIEWFETKQ